jgi:hypothetical protein
MLGAGIASLAISESIDTLAGFLFAAVCSVAVGAILIVKAPGNRVGQLALAAGSAWIVYTFGIAYGQAALSAAPGAMPGAYVFGWAGSWAGALFPLGVATLILCFPTGKPVGWWRVMLFGHLVALASTMIGAVLLWGLPLSTLVDSIQISEVSAYRFVDIGFILGFFLTVPATLSVVARYRRAEMVERQQIKWLLAATCLFAVSFLIGVFTGDRSEAVWWVNSVALAGMPVAILFAVLRYRLYEIDRIISRTVGYLLVVALLGVLFFAAVTTLGSVFPAESPLAVAGSTLAVAALFNPLRRRVQEWVDRRFNRARYDARRVMERFAGSLQGRVDSQEVVEGWLGVVSATMQPASISVWVRNDFGTVSE